MLVSSSSPLLISTYADACLSIARRVVRSFDIFPPSGRSQTEDKVKNNRIVQDRNLVGRWFWNLCNLELIGSRAVASCRCVCSTLSSDCERWEEENLNRKWTTSCTLNYLLDTRNHSLEGGNDTNDDSKQNCTKKPLTWSFQKVLPQSIYRFPRRDKWRQESRPQQRRITTAPMHNPVSATRSIRRTRKTHLSSLNL